MSLRMVPFDVRGLFAPVVSSEALRGVTIRGAGITLLGSGAALILQLIAAAVLGRLLTPSDFGVFTMVVTFSLLFMNFGLNGFTEAVIQRETLDHGLASNLFWINFAIGLVLAFVFAASGPVLAWFFKDARVLPACAAMALTIVFTSASVLHLGLLKRAMQFAAISANDIAGRIASVVVAIVLAKCGFGYWALICGAISIPLCNMFGAWWLCRWIPGRPRSRPETAPCVRYAFNTYGRFCVNYFARNLDNVLVGWRFNAQALGFYKKAYDLFALSASQLVGTLTTVAVAGLSRLTHDLTQYRRYFLNAVAVLAFIGMALAGDLTLVGKDLTRLLLGPGWERTGVIFTYFAPGIGIMILYHTHGWIHLSIGNADRWFRWGIVEVIVTAALFVPALRWGPEGIAVAWTVSFCLLLVPGLWYAGKPIQLKVGMVLGVAWRYLLSSFMAVVVSAFVAERFWGGYTATSVQASATRLVLVSLLFMTLYCAAIVALHRGVAPLRDLLSLLRDMAPKAKSSAVQPPVAVCGELD